MQEKDKQTEPTEQPTDEDEPTETPVTLLDSTHRPQKRRRADLYPSYPTTQ